MSKYEGHQPERSPNQRICVRNSEREKKFFNTEFVREKIFVDNESLVKEVIEEWIEERIE